MVDHTKPDLHLVETAVPSDNGGSTIAVDKAAVGTVQLFVQDETVLIPTPSPDPNDPLNLPSWRKWSILLLMAAYGSTAVILASGMGAIFTAVVHDYPGKEARANDLLTYPALFMGLGNLISMPLALAVGRRPVFIVTMILMVASGIGCALAPNLTAHIAFRDLMSFAAGQSEALCPMIVQEVHFLHERGRKLAWFAAIENIIIGAFFIASNPLVSARGWRWWYWLFTIINCAILVFTYFFMTETLYNRPDDAAEGAVHLHFNEKGEVDANGAKSEVIRVTTKHGNVLDVEKYGQRTWKRDLSLVPAKPKWGMLLPFYKELLQCLCIPSMFWVLLLNGSFLGLYIITTATFAPVLIPPPYNFGFQNLGLVFLGQIVSALIFLPLLGYGTDMIIKFMSKKNRGVYEPEFRLITLIIPAIVAVVCGVIYGQAAQFPSNWNWGAIATTMNGTFFAFLGANIVGLTYAIDSFPLRAAPLLVLICAGRGIISFGLSYSVLPAVAAIGYDGTMNVESGIAGGLALLGIPVYIFGSRLRKLGDKWFNLGGQHE